MNFIVKQILMSPSPPDPVRAPSTFRGLVISLMPYEQGDMDVDIEWVEKANVLPSLSKRVLALKVCRNRCLAHAESDTALDMATPALKMFFALLENGGSLHGENDDESVALSKTKSIRIKTKLTVSIIVQRSKPACGCKQLCLCYIFQQCQSSRLSSQTILSRLPS